MDLTDENGNLSASYDQDAFGNVLAGIQSGYHLTTKEFSPLINLYYFFQRWYNAQIGRFIIKSNFPPDQEHPYAYCENNPVSLVDVSGEYPNGEIHKIA
ncbi:MAG: RHS repeat-associated core domain-containing protein, partial [Thermoplasmata archaeon]